MYFHEILEILTSTLGITCLVMVMMLLIEFVNVSSSGHLLEKLQSHPFLQIFIASLLGLIPGCIGGFTIVSLYTHRLLSFGALVAGMISTFGDSAFLLFAISPETTPPLFAALFGIAIVAGFCTHFLFKNKNFYSQEVHTLKLHDEHSHQHGKIGLSLHNIHKISFPRAILLFGLIVYLIALGTGAISHEHGSMPQTNIPLSEVHNHSCCDHVHCDNTSSIDEHPYYPPEMDAIHDTPAHEHHVHGENIIFGILAFITLIVVAFCTEHFLQEHLWEHVIKHHFMSVLLWTLGVLLVLSILSHFINLPALIEDNRWVTLLLLFIAVGIGIIPESQPQFIWIYLYAGHMIPFSILLASSVVQDGHGALPLLAYSRRSFFMMKAVNIFFGIAIGLLGYWGSW